MLRAIEYFNFIRDIPYRIPTSLREPDYCCSGKHKILFELLKPLGLKVRYRVCEFLWSRLDLPENILKVPHEDLCTHTYLEVYVTERDKWVIVDATWDKRLANKFTINEWDGVSDTEIAVKPSKIYTPEESEEYVKKESEEDIIKDQKINGEFYKAFNDYLETIRAKP